MRTYEILSKKRDGKRLSGEEFRFLIRNFVEGKIPDYQMSAFLMAAYINGLDQDELVALTKVMIDSGEKLDLSEIPGTKVDKHSTGGVGDKTTLVLAPLVASLGVPVAKLSGRGLGHTGGTLDKLESIPGFKVDLSPSRFVEQVNQIGVAISSASEKITPADKKLYALRDVTATVSSIPLIASSIVSKKIAGGADAIVFDVKCGSGAFIKTVEEAEDLATKMVEMVKSMGKSSVAVISNMDQPLGFAIGNSLEVAEAIETLKGEGPSDLEDLVLNLGAQILLLCGKTARIEDGKKSLIDAIESGKALAKFEELILAQEGDPSCLESSKVLPRADFISEFSAQHSGYITGIDAEGMGQIAVELGAGRITKDTQIDLAAGLVLEHKIGHQVSKGDVLGKAYSNRIDDFTGIKQALKGLIEIGPNELKTQPMVYKIIGLPGAT